MHIRDVAPIMVEFGVTIVLMVALVIVVVMELPFQRNVLLIMPNVVIIPPHKLQLMLQQV